LKYLILITLIIINGCTNDDSCEELDEYCVDGIKSKVIYEGSRWEEINDQNEVIDSGTIDYLASIKTRIKPCDNSSQLDSEKIFSLDSITGDTLSYCYSTDEGSFFWYSYMPRSIELIRSSYVKDEDDYYVISRWDESTNDTIIKTTIRSVDGKKITTRIYENTYDSLYVKYYTDDSLTIISKIYLYVNGNDLQWIRENIDDQNAIIYNCK